MKYFLQKNSQAFATYLLSVVYLSLDCQTLQIPQEEIYKSTDCYFE